MSGAIQVVRLVVIAYAMLHTFALMGYFLTVVALVPQGHRPDGVAVGEGVAASQSPGINGNGATPTPQARFRGRATFVDSGPRRHELSLDLA